MCDHPNRANLDRRLLANAEPMSGIARDAGFSETAVWRHGLNHLGIDTRRTPSPSDLSPSSFVHRINEIADDAQEVREHARRTNDGELRLKAGVAEAKSLSLLMTRLGVDDAATSEALREAHALVGALGRVLPSFPAVAEALSDELLRVGEYDLALGITNLTSTKSPREISA
jgi:hypothetical protein